MSEPRWLVEARKNIGQRELRGNKHNPLILRWWELIRAPFTDDETPWCAGFVGAMLESAGVKSTRSAWARSYLNWGQRLRNPVVGCIVVFSRGPRSGHVGFVVGQDKRGNLLVLGGNQGDAVNIRPFSVSRVLGYRWPAGVPITGGSLPVSGSKDKPSINEASIMGDTAVGLMQPDDPGAEPESGGLVNKITHYLNGIGASIAAVLGSLFDWKVAALAIAAGVIIFMVLYFFPRKQ